MNCVRRFNEAQAGIGLMCSKCDDIDKDILHYRKLVARVTDEQSVEGFQQLIAKLEAKKKLLHPEPEQ